MFWAANGLPKLTKLCRSYRKEGFRVSVMRPLASPEAHANKRRKWGSEARKDYLDGLAGISSSLAVVFQRLAQKDEGGTYSLASRLERPELRASAMLGTLMGLPDLEAEAPTESN